MPNNQRRYISFREDIEVKRTAQAFKNVKLLTEFKLRVLRVHMCGRLDPRRLVRLAPERFTLPRTLGELCEVLLLFPLVLRPSEEADCADA